MASEPLRTTTTAAEKEKRHRSIFELPANFFDSCALLTSSGLSVASTFETSNNSNNSALETLDESVSDSTDQDRSLNAAVSTRWTCNTCKAEFESLQEQRFHFKSDIHRFNVKLSLAGKNIVKEEDFDELTSDSFKDFDVSSISGSEDDEPEKVGPFKLSRATARQKLLIHLQTGERISIWKCLITNESGPEGNLSCDELLGRLNTVVHEPRDNTCFRVVLLASGGHFAGCVFDGSKIVAHKTFHRYVVRAKSGKKQSSNDASGRFAHSAGASLRRHNELALKKDIQELLAAWKPYFDASSCVFVYAPSSNHQLLSNRETPYFSHQKVRNIPIPIRRPTMKEARRIYDQLTQVSYEQEENEAPLVTKNELPSSSGIENDIISSMEKVNIVEPFVEPSTEACSSSRESNELPISSESSNEVKGSSTPLHEAAQSGNALKVLELLEQGLDPCARDERGQTPYTVANEKEVRNTFRRFMASNLDKWDWNAAKVPSALTKEMEESQAAKQAEKEAKRKAKAKELKKLRKEKEKKAQAEAAASKNTSTITKSSSSSQPSRASQISKEEELKRALVAEREKRAAAAERRMAAAAALSAQGNSTTPQPKTGEAGEGADGGCGYGPSDANGGGGGGRVSGKLVMIIVVVTTMALKWWQWRRRRQ
ncbi:ankyrin repeat and zinc finger domain-containing protein 1 isoform X1 [Rosa chinensis]|uniref:ankyrin repeat and zinc finger domain-containing protein 1 isoform X1 n=1 Tax=Rosa chinensis TaxID=74649 RepID=UPI001AD94844|nr:ankyrin repeat and zinc finger domain-containing protein 1 isoform X1 [Rosa chinensis]